MNDWIDDLDEEEREEWNQFVSYQRTHTLKSMADSAFVVSLLPGADFDIKFAVETGIAIMLDKPIMIIASPGGVIPGKLALVADKVLYVDIDTEEGRVEVERAIQEMANADNDG